MPLAPHARLGAYEVVEPLGKGGMGEVYRARDTRLGREVAIKVLPEQTASSPDALARFDFEARAVATLNHPNILALHDVGAESGVSYVVMELLEGETLREWLRREGAMPPRKALDVAVQLARGLAAAHERGIIHRDLKPDNIFLTSDGWLKILDFGLALQHPPGLGAGDAETRFATEPGLLIGTVGYMAPEQARGEPATIRSDIFSFGLVVYEVLTGSNPFTRETTAETLVAIMRQPLEGLARVSGAPPGAARLIDRCLEKRPGDRPESTRDLAFALEAASEEATPARRAPGAAQPIERAALVTRRSLAAACALILLLTFVLWGYVRLRADRSVGGEMAAELERAERLTLHAQQDRIDRLQLNARLVASFPNLKALFETDAPTIRDFLQSYQQRNPGTPLLMALDANGFVLARTDEVPSAVPGKGQEWLAALISGTGAGVIAIDGRSYHAAASSAEAASTVFGYVIAAAPIDNTFAQVLRDIAEAETVLLDQRGVAGSSLRTGQVPWRSLAEFRAGGSPTEVAIGPTTFGAREVVLAEAPQVAALILEPRENVRGPYRGIQNGILVAGLTFAGLILAAGLVIRRQRG